MCMLELGATTFAHHRPRSRPLPAPRPPIFSLSSTYLFVRMLGYKLLRIEGGLQGRVDRVGVEAEGPGWEGGGQDRG